MPRVKSSVCRVRSSLARNVEVVLAFLRINSSFHKKLILRIQNSGRGTIKPVVEAKTLSKFDPKTFLSSLDGGRKIAAFRNKQPIFVQGDPSDCVFYIQKGKIKLTVVSVTCRARCVPLCRRGPSGRRVS
jgi:CRP-like cAMP-binding protein